MTKYGWGNDVINFKIEFSQTIILDFAQPYLENLDL